MWALCPSGQAPPLQCPLPPPVLQRQGHFIFIRIRGLEVRTVLQKQLLSLLLQGLLPAGTGEATTESIRGLLTRPHRWATGASTSTGTAGPRPGAKSPGPVSLQEGLKLRFLGQGRVCIASAVLPKRRQFTLYNFKHTFICALHSGICLLFFNISGLRPSPSAPAPVQP